jgi:ACS family tartrate transporter-like MFS transporter
LDRRRNFPLPPCEGKQREKQAMSQTTPTSPEGTQPPPVIAVIEPLERETIRRVAWRLMPLLVVGYFCNYIDRMNVGFAALTMNKAIGLSSAAFGFGAGMFFVGYLLFEVPSNLIMAKVGARRWIARIMFTWGIVAGLTAFVWNDWSFAGIRFVLGLAEAGFFPGILIYLTWWFPSYYRARMQAIFYSAQTISLIIGPPVSAWLMTLDGTFGLEGWKLLFLAEALPPIIMSFVFWFYLTDRPRDATWLRPEQRVWLQARLDSETAQREAVRRYGTIEALLNPRVWLFVVVYFGYTSASTVVAFFLPQMVKALGTSMQMTGYVSALPYVFGMAAMLYFSLGSDRTGSRIAYAAGACLVGTAGLATCSLVGVDHTVILIIALIVGVTGVQSFGPLFWPIPTAMLSGFAAAGGIALINSVGNLSGLVAPTLYGFIKDAAGGHDQIPLLVISAGPLLSAIVLMALGHDRRLERIPHA